MRWGRVASAALLLAACTATPAPPTTSVAPGSALSTPPSASASSSIAPATATVMQSASAPIVPASPPQSSSVAPSGAGSQALLPDPAAASTIGDTVRLAGGEFVGDQADVTLLEAVRRAELAADGAPEYAFLVEITGLDAETFPYNLRDFALLDDESFTYEAYPDGGREPALTFGDLPPGRKVKGWLTFAGPGASSFLELEYSPALALQPAYFRVRLP